MTFEGYDAFDDPYAYPGTSILKNLLDIQDQATLEAFEVEISSLRAEEPLPEGAFDPDHYCSIHRHLFQDVYEWAGQYRTVRTSKGGNSFCYPEYIPVQMNSLFGSIQGGNIFRQRTPQEFIREIARFLGELKRFTIPRGKRALSAGIHRVDRGNNRSSIRL